MNITFFIGNGFDLNLGLATRYVDFYPYFLKHASKDNVIRTWLENDKKEIVPGSDDETAWSNTLWADMEEELGKKLSLLSYSAKLLLYDGKYELDDLLWEYLARQLQLFSTSGNEDAVAKEMVRSLIEFERGMSEEDRQSIKVTFDAHKGENHKYCFVCFNYTETLDQILALTQKTSSPIRTRKVGSSTLNDDIGAVVHIHGTLAGEMILGVNDETQIENDDLKKDEEFKAIFIKSRMNSEIGQRKTEHVKDLIVGSRIICVFGMSIGSTDKMWWKEIVTWLKKSTDCKLIIYYKGYDAELKRMNPGRVILLKSKLKRQLLTLAGILNESSDYQALEKRIHLSFNSDIFSFDGLVSQSLRSEEEKPLHRSGQSNVEKPQKRVKQRIYY